MASLDLGTLVAHIKVEGAAAAQNVLRGVSNVMGQTGTSATGATTGIGSFTSALTGGLSHVNIFGTNLGTLATAFGGSEMAAVAMGTAIGSVAVAGVLAGIKAIKELSAACVDFVKDSVKVGISFQHQMSVVQAISGEGAAGLTTLTNAARQFGKDTVFSATQAAQAMEYTALAGWSAQESIEGLPGILNLAAASNMDLAKASDIVTDYLTAFGMQVSESTKLADIMAYAMSNTNTNTLQLGEAYKSCAATCTAFGVSVEEGTAWLGMLANAGIKGSEAGTALNAVLARMYGETKTANKEMQKYGLTMYESNGKAKNFTTVMGELQEAMAGMTDQEQALFLKGVAGVNHLSDFATMAAVSADEVKGLTTELENCAGTSEKMAKTMTDNIWGLQKSIGSKVESIKLSIFNAIEPMITMGLKLVETFTSVLSDVLKPFGDYLNAFVAPVKEIFVAIMDIIQIVSSKLVPIISGPLRIMTTILQGIAQLVRTIAQGVVDAVDTIMGVFEPIQGGLDGICEGIQKVFDFLSNTIGKVITIIIDLINTFVVTCTSAGERFENMMNDGLLAYFRMTESEANAWNKLLSDAWQLTGMSAEEANQAIINMGFKTSETLKEQVESTFKTIAEVCGESTDKVWESFEEMYEAIQELDDETYSELKASAEDYKDEFSSVMDAVDDYESDMLKKKLKKWDETHKSMEGTQNWFIKRAQYAAEQEEKISARTADTREKLNKQYTNKLENEFKKQQLIQSNNIVDNTKNYQKDYAEFAKNEEAKTRKLEEETKKRKETASAFVSWATAGAGNGRYVADITGVSGWGNSDIRGAYANGTDYVPSTGSYLVGERGPEIVTLRQGSSVTPNHELGGNTTNHFNVSINASSVREFNDIVNICQGYKQLNRMGV